jgi:hypothetical protein
MQSNLGDSVDQENRLRPGALGTVTGQILRFEARGSSRVFERSTFAPVVKVIMITITSGGCPVTGSGPVIAAAVSHWLGLSAVGRVSAPACRMIEDGELRVRVARHDKIDLERIRCYRDWRAFRSGDLTHSIPVLSRVTILE